MTTFTCYTEPLFFLYSQQLSIILCNTLNAVGVALTYICLVRTVAANGRLTVYRSRDAAEGPTPPSTANIWPRGTNWKTPRSLFPRSSAVLQAQEES